MLVPNQLRSFVALAETRSFTRAAEVLDASQPTISRHLKLLEAELGQPLVEQYGRQVHLTEAGRTLELEARRVLGALTRAEDAVRAHAAAERGRLRIAASSTPGLTILPAALRRFLERRPGIELDLRIENTARVVQLLEENRVDAGLVGASVDSKELEGERLVDDEIVFFQAEDGPARTLSDLSDVLLIRREEGSATRALAEGSLADQGIRPRRSLVLPSQDAVRSLALSGLGVGYGSRLSIADDLALGRLEVVPTPTPLVRPLLLVRHVHKRPVPELEAFLKLLWSLAQDGSLTELVTHRSAADNASAALPVKRRSP